MNRLFYVLLFALVALSVSAQETGDFYDKCVNEILALKDKWPSVTNWKGEKVLTPFYEVKKDVRMKFAEEFMRTSLYTAAKAQPDIVIGKKHQIDNKIIESRTINSMSFTAHFHADEYIISISKDFITKKWVLEFTYNHESYSSQPPVDNIDINIDGSQRLKGNSYDESYCVLANIARYRYDNHKVGLEVTDSSAQSMCKSDKNEDLGVLSAWGKE
ncbi:MAG: hypothetical protein KBT09_10095 [Bacteroidales bacterium]|nr:hypothetical protein [Candidatus Sodaliphilus fimicaballi]